jgi:hypothetical protein
MPNKELTPREQLDAFAARYDPAIASLAKTVLTKLRRLLPGAFEIVYDNYNALVIGFSPTDRTSDAFLSIALYPRWVTLFFLNGASLPDPSRILEGSGKQVRGVRISKASDLDRADIIELSREATSRSPQLIPARKRGTMIIRSISAKQRPRMPANKRTK